jgi:alpha-D-xyloside xylohydrolase
MYRYENDDRIRVHLTDGNHPRWEVPPSLIPRATTAELAALRNTTPDDLSQPITCRKLGFSTTKNEAKSDKTLTHPLKFSYTTEPFGFAITRTSDNEVLFNTTPATGANPNDSSHYNTLVFKDQYIEISTQLPPTQSALYGLGEGTHKAGLRLAPGNTYTLWATDIGSYWQDVDLYGSYPFYMDVRKGGVAHGVQLVNSNAMDVTYEKEFLTFRIIGGVLDFYFFAGPSPRAVMDQYTQFVGRPVPIPYWVLGQTASLSLSWKLKLSVHLYLGPVHTMSVQVERPCD